MPEQITLYTDANRISPFCLRVELALEEAGVSYKTHGFDVYSRPSWYTKVNPLTGKIPTITYGGPDAPPEDPSPLSLKITESSVILEFFADVFPNAQLLPSTSDPAARARARFFIDTVVRNLDGTSIEFLRGIPDAGERVVEALLKIQALLPDPDAGEYALGKEFTNADCMLAPLLAFMDIAAAKDLGRFEPGTGKKLDAALAGERFDRLRRYKKALWERESVKKLLDLNRMEAGIRKVFGQK